MFDDDEDFLDEYVEYKMVMEDSDNDPHPRRPGGGGGGGGCSLGCLGWIVVILVVCYIIGAME